MFPLPIHEPETIVFPEGKQTPAGWKKIVTKRAESGIDYFLSETTGWNNPFRLGPQRAALVNLPEDEERFPMAVWIKRFLMEGVDFLLLNSEAMRRPSPPGSPKEFRPDGSNLPQAIEQLKTASPENFARWLEHVKTALPAVASIETVERPEFRRTGIAICNSNIPMD
jgi:hypothetical protein